jgi:hypothetical protein
VCSQLGLVSLANLKTPHVLSCACRSSPSFFFFYCLSGRRWGRQKEGKTSARTATSRSGADDSRKGSYCHRGADSPPCGRFAKKETKTLSSQSAMWSALQLKPLNSRVITTPEDQTWVLSRNSVRGALVHNIGIHPPLLLFLFFLFLSIFFWCPNTLKWNHCRRFHTMDVEFNSSSSA